MGPSYLTCNERQSACTRKKADPRRGCQTCEWTIKYKMFTEETQAELKKLKRTTRAGAKRWPFKKMLEVVSEIATLAGRKTPNPKWTVGTSLLVSVYKDERAKKRFIDSYNAKEEEDARQKELEEKRLEALRKQGRR